jgi:adenine deaminase
MKSISGYIYDSSSQSFFEGEMFYGKRIIRFEKKEVVQKQYIIPGFVDSHIHIESSLLTPLEYSKVAITHGFIGALADAHEIANVCGVEGLNFMLQNAAKTPMKIFFGVPSCVPATIFESSGAIIDADKVFELFQTKMYTHLGEMMNYPGVIAGDEEVFSKIKCALGLGHRIDGHAPMLSGVELRKYIDAGITSDHEATSLQEAKEKIKLGMKIMIRCGSATCSLMELYPLINSYPKMTMICSDDCHPYDLERGYLKRYLNRAIENDVLIQNLIDVASVNPIDHFALPIGLLKIGDPADYIVVDDLENFNVKTTVINGTTVFDGTTVFVSNIEDKKVNNFYINDISINDLSVEKTNSFFRVIKINENSLITDEIVASSEKYKNKIHSDVEDDIIKVIVLNRYREGKPTIGFVKGFNIRRGAFGSSIAHDSHNIIVAGVNDEDILSVVKLIQENRGGVVFSNAENNIVLPLPIAGLMSSENCNFASLRYQKIIDQIRNEGCTLKDPVMALSFLALLVIPDLKISDLGLFSVSKFNFVALQS